MCPIFWKEHCSIYALRLNLDIFTLCARCAHKNIQLISFSLTCNVIKIRNTLRGRYACIYWQRQQSTWWSISIDINTTIKQSGGRGDGIIVSWVILFSSSSFYPTFPPSNSCSSSLARYSRERLWQHRSRRSPSGIASSVYGDGRVQQRWCCRSDGQFRGFVNAAG